MAYIDSNLNDPSLFFNIVLYTGNGTAIGSGGQAITGVGFAPNLTWIKERSSTSPHKLLDTVRGATKELESNGTNAEATTAESLAVFGSDGFTVGSNGAVNENSQTYVSWNWKAGGGSSSSNEDGSINTTSTSVSTNAGFSISKYTGNATNGATVGTGLGAAPDFIFGKDLSDTSGWCVWHKDLTDAGYKLSLNGTDAQSDDVYAFGGSSRTAPTSTVFSLGEGGGLNGSNANVVYCFTPKQGFSKFGKYTGNGNVSGPMIVTGMRPAWIMIKKMSSTGSWTIQDNKRDVDNPALIRLFPDTTDADTSSTSYSKDFLSNGFKIRNTNGNENASGATYIYAAFAEAPFVNSNGVPCNAR